MDLSYKKELRRLWDVFWFSDEDEAQTKSLELHDFLKNISKLDAEDYYLWGLSIYSLNKPNAIIESHVLFLKSLEKNSDEYLARLYSAHCYHDVANYQMALNEYLKVNQKVLKTEMPIWRWVKLLEQIGFCYVKTDNIEKAYPYFKKIVDAYRTIEPDELVPIQEAYECLPENHELITVLKEAENYHFR